MNSISNLLMINYVEIFGIKIYFYAMTMVLALVACAVCAYFLFKKRGIPQDYILDVMIAIIPCAIICARLWYVFMEFEDFLNADGWLDFTAVVSTRNGGMAIHGGILGGAIGLIIISKIKKIRLGKLWDVGATLLPLGQAIGRWGNFFNQEVYGKPTDVTWFPYSVYIEKTGQYHHALFFYEMVLNLMLFAVLLAFLLKYKGRRNYYVSSGYLIGYGIIRAVLEPLRSAEYQMGNGAIPSSVITALVMIALGVILLGVLLYFDITEKNYWWKDMFKKSAPQVALGDAEILAEDAVLVETEIKAEGENLVVAEQNLENLEDNSKEDI